MKLSGFLTFLLLLIPASQQSADQLVAALDKFNKEYPQEKVYLHLDKPYYYSGEDIWFKAYLVVGAAHQPSVFSDNIFVELIDEAGNLLLRNRILLENGMGRGDFDLPELPSGNYTIRAYSHWMRNFDPDFFYHKELAIISPIDGNPPAKTSDKPLTLSFHPEGGDLVNHVTSRLAVKVSNDERIGNNVRITLYNQAGQALQEQVTNEDGITVFELKPVPGQRYYAKLEGQEEPFELPKAEAQGFVLSAHADNPKALKFSVRTHNPNIKSHSLYLIGQSRGNINYASRVDFTDSVAQVTIPADGLAAGINQFTLFDQDWLPVAERLVFQQPEDLLDISIATDKPNYESRDSTTVSLTVKDKQGNPVQGSFSLTALDAFQINAALTEDHIVSHLLLTSDIKGYIRNPARFFGPHAAENRNALDLIMMTHGWRRFAWKDLLANTYPEVNYGVQQGVTVQGRLLTKEGGEPVSGGSISHMGTFKNKPSMMGTQSVEGGFFAMGNLYFYENEENYLKGAMKGRKRKIKELFVEIDTTTNEPAPVTIRSIPILGLDTAVIEDHIEKSIERQQIQALMEFDDEARDLGEVVVEGVRARDSEKYGQQYQELDFDKYVNATKNGANPMDVLRGRMPNVIIRGIGANMESILTYNTTIRNPNTNPLILLDGLPITMAQLRAIPAGTIKRAEVYRGTEELQKAGRGPGEILRGGVLEFTSRTKEEMLQYYKLVGDKNVKTLPGGFYKSREFFAPRYGPKDDPNILPDRRMLIHWEPMIQTNEQGEATLTFFNADSKTTIQIAVQGLSLQGVPGISTMEYQVKRRSITSK